MVSKSDWSLHFYRHGHNHSDCFRNPNTNIVHIIIASLSSNFKNIVVELYLSIQYVCGGRFESQLNLFITTLEWYAQCTRSVCPPSNRSDKTSYTYSGLTFTNSYMFCYIERSSLHLSLPSIGVSTHNLLGQRNSITKKRETENRKYNRWAILDVTSITHVHQQFRLKEIWKCQFAFRDGPEVIRPPMCIETWLLSKDGIFETV